MMFPGKKGSDFFDGTGLKPTNASACNPDLIPIADLVDNRNLGSFMNDK